MKIEDDKFTILNIRDIYQKLLEQYNSKDDLELDFTNIDEIDISGIQLLLSLKQSCDKNNKNFKIINIKDDILYSLELIDTKTMLGV